MIIKVILIAGTLVLGFIALRQRATGATLAIRRLGGAAIIVVGTVLVLWPNTTTTVANAIGVGRGTDLLLYALVMAFMFTTISIHQKLYVLDQRVTSLVRELALLELERTPATDQQETDD
jgi:hypothetical protein